MNPSGPATPLHPDVPVVLDRTYFSSNVAGRRSGSTYHLGFGVNGQAQTTCKRAGWPEFGCPCLALRSLFFWEGGGGAVRPVYQLEQRPVSLTDVAWPVPRPPSHEPGEGGNWRRRLALAFLADAAYPFSAAVWSAVAVGCGSL